MPLRVYNRKPDVDDVACVPIRTWVALTLLSWALVMGSVVLYGCEVA